MLSYLLTCNRVKIRKGPLEWASNFNKNNMLDIKQFLSAIKQIAEEKGIAEENVLETIEAAIASAYKRDYGKKGQIIKAKLDMDTGKLDVTQVFYVVEGADEEGYITGPLPIKVTEDKQDFEGERSRRRDFESEGEIKETEEGELKIKFNPEKHILLEDAKKKSKKIKVGDEMIVKLESKTEFGRIAAQPAKQVVIQILREAERDAIFSEFKKREGEIISGVVQRKEGALVFVDLGKTNGLLIPAEQVYGDNYRLNQRFRFVILK